MICKTTEEESNASFFYCLSILISSSIMSVLFGFLWLKFRKSEENEFPARLSLCMMVFNMFLIIRFVCGRALNCHEDADDFLYYFLATLWLISVMIYLTAFNLGNWYFGFHYYKCASEMEFVTAYMND